MPFYDKIPKTLMAQSLIMTEGPRKTHSPHLHCVYIILCHSTSFFMVNAMTLTTKTRLNTSKKWNIPKKCQKMPKNAQNGQNPMPGSPFLRFWHKKGGCNEKWQKCEKMQKNVKKSLLGGYAPPLKRGSKMVSSRENRRFSGPPC